MTDAPSSSLPQKPAGTGHIPLDNLFEQTQQVWRTFLAHPKLPGPPVKVINIYCLVWPKEIRVELDVDPFGQLRYKIEDKRETQLALMTRDVDLAVARLSKLSSDGQR